MAAMCVHAIWTASAPSISSRGAAASIIASAAFMESSEIPPKGERAAACIWNNEVFTKSLDVVPRALFSLCHQFSASPSGGWTLASLPSEGQDPENQLRDLRAWCSNSGHTIVQEYIDRQSGRRGADKRQQFAALLEAAARRKFDCVLFWALDRFSREGMAQTIAHLQRLTSYGVSFHSYTEPHLSTDNELVRNILLAWLSSLAKLEAQKISERTRAGMARAKANGD